MGDYADRRRTAIEDAAFALLIEKGYKATSMLEVARRAGASNETLYKWYGNKQGLFAALVKANARDVAELLRTRLDGADADPLETLATVGPLLLDLVTGERAIALNRAAVGDVHDTATLGPALAESGREAVVPLIAELLGRARDRGLLAFDDAGEVAETYVALLIGDLQIRRATGAIGPLPDDAIRTRAMRAVGGITRLFRT
ncbi:MAG: TetR/AcrR family transcriptional regulator [Roseitalea sp.]|jgi:AcrR family transcriptional regulator|uniref:TetR/AcrR family transcriptional regulator n=1 Tax=Alphaproteobacteria TaxID=28211 RepID=UPI000F3F754A|nr:TetR/AcrR family transcriptional regulator [Oceaniradius stylonematis]MBO6553924.1 TetR/AcrR family transcriptional regulator [Roseitalea sp.]MBO6952952.1 TetR/AcrR family transcriptional regulator [Rhizobiaceae bacterium]RNC96614.1 MAG: TetR/AcrR family transcriptional regulator [Oricola sp.]MBO6593299.1 TetR/AcrR family transcriptional regulator [Roseitalea sp.]MBO6600711.1 TetR/AcrR family transcriptional regulator [Roseitalea sp.]